jgi:hypothetical protein
MATAAKTAPCVRLFYSYAHEDEELRNRLEAHLSLLERNGVIQSWHDRRITGGQEWAGAIHQEMERADVILLLISASFLRSDYCYDVEMRRALERHGRGEALVIPIILRPVDWDGAPFGKLQCLPRNALAVTLWRDADEAFQDVARGIRRAIAGMTGATAAEPIPPSEDSAQQRVLDAAVPAQVRVGEATEVLAMVATASSAGLRGVLMLEAQSYSAATEDVHSSGFELTFPVDERGKRGPRTVTVALESPDFEPPRTLKKIQVPPEGDSTVCTLFVTPKRAGVLSLELEVRLDDVTILAQRLRTAGAAAMPAVRSYTLTSVPMSTVSYVLPKAVAPAAVPAPAVPARRRAFPWHGAAAACLAVLSVGGYWTIRKTPDAGAVERAQEERSDPQAKEAKELTRLMILSEATEAYQRGDPKESLRILDAAKEPSAEMLVLRGHALSRLRDYDGARNAYRMAADMKPDEKIYSDFAAGAQRSWEKSVEARTADK